MTTLTTRADPIHQTHQDHEDAGPRPQPRPAPRSAPPEPPQGTHPQAPAPNPPPSLRSDFLTLLLHPDYHAELLASILDTPLHKLAGALSAEQARRAIDTAVEVADERLRLIRAEAERAAWARLLDLAANFPTTPRDRETSRKAASHILRILTRPNSSPVADGGGPGAQRRGRGNSAPTTQPPPPPGEDQGERSHPSGPLSESHNPNPSPAPAGEVAERSKAGGGASDLPPPLPPPAGEDRGEGSRPSGPPSKTYNPSPAPAREVAEQSKPKGAASNTPATPPPPKSPDRKGVDGFNPHRATNHPASQHPSPHPDHPQRAHPPDHPHAVNPPGASDQSCHNPCSIPPRM